MTRSNMPVKIRKLRVHLSKDGDKVYQDKDLGPRDNAYASNERYSKMIRSNYQRYLSC